MWFRWAVRTSFELRNNSISPQAPSIYASPAHAIVPFLPVQARSRMIGAVFQASPLPGLRGGVVGDRSNAMPSALRMFLAVDVRVAIAQACGVWFFFILLVQAIGTVQL